MEGGDKNELKNEITSADEKAGVNDTRDTSNENTSECDVKNGQDASFKNTTDYDVKNAQDMSNESTAGEDVKNFSESLADIGEIKMTQEENFRVNGVEDDNSVPNTGYTIHDGTDVIVKSEISDDIAAAGIPVGLGDLEPGNIDIKSEPSFKVFVGGLDDSVTEEVLRTFIIEETKCTEDDVLSVNITCQIVKNSKKYGIAFVDFSNEEIYKVALTLNNSFFKGSTISVLPSHKTHEGIMFMDCAQPSKEGSEDMKDSSHTGKLPVYKKSDHVAYIKNLPHGVTEDEVLEFFKFTRADVVDMTIPLTFRAKRNAKRPMRAIIAFPTKELLQKCLDQTHTVFRDREVIVERHKVVPKVVPGEKRSAPSSEDKEGENCAASPKKQVRLSNLKGNPPGVQVSGQLEMDLFVKHIPREASDRQIKDFFYSAGATVSKVNMFSECVTGSTRGMGFVSMFNKESLKKGLLLDCKRFFKNKVRVAVRRDRDHLVQLDSADTIPNYCTFVSSLPLREKPEVLKQAIVKHFETRGQCAVKEVHVPLPMNRSGNRGYAFVIFDDETSLKNGQALNNTLMRLGKGCMKISTTDRWPENPSHPSGGFAKGRQADAIVGPDSSGKLRKRKKASVILLPGLPPPIVQTPAVRPGLSAAEEGFGGGVRWNGPPPRQAGNDPSFGRDPPEFYLDYLEFRDYVALRKTMAARRDLLQLQGRDTNAPSDAVAQPKDGGGALALFTAAGQRSLAREERSGTAAGPREAELRELALVMARRAGGSGGFRDLGPRAEDVGCSGISARGRSSNISFGSSDRGSFSDSFASSLNSSRYQTADSSLSRSRLFDDSMVSTSSLDFSRDGSSFYDPSNGLENDRGGVGVGVGVGGGGIVGNSRFSAGLSSGNVDNSRGFSSLSNVRSGILETARPLYDNSSYSELGRGNSFCGGIEGTTGFSSRGVGAYSGNDKRHPY